MGAKYGQSSRFLLNHDAVFLAELLSHIQQSHSSERMPAWVSEYRSFNCLALPAAAASLPLPLVIASDVTILLAALKLDDQRKDTKHIGWLVAKNLFGSLEQKACKSLEECSFPLADIWELYSEQDRIEASACAIFPSANDLTARVDYCAGPTAAITSTVFRHATQVVCGDARQQDAMQAIGSSFGRLIYLVDAIEDYSRDVRLGQFNPLLINDAAIAGGKGSTTGSRISASLLEIVLPYARFQFDCIEKNLFALSIDNTASSAFAKRLRDNLTSRLGRGWSTCSSHCREKIVASADTVIHSCNVFKISWSDRPQFARLQALRLLGQGRPGQSLKRAWKEQFTFAYLWLTAFLFPYFAKQSSTLSECLSINFNLIAWGNLVNDLRRMPAEFGFGMRPAFAAMSGSGGWSSSGGGEGDGGDEPPVDPGIDPNIDPRDPKRRRSKRRFGQREPGESPSITPGNDSMPPSTASGRWKDDSYRYRDPSQDSCSRCCGDYLACEACVDGCNCCCSSSECCAGGSGDCCACGGGDCCAGSGGGDCCAGSGDCCGSADCGSCDCGGADCSGCSCN